MRNLWLAAGVTLALAAGAACANPLDDAKAGMQAYNRGDNAGAVRLFTFAINSRRLLKSDQELALVKRAEARINLGQAQLALSDAYSALTLDPADNEAIATRDRAQAMLNPPPATPQAPAAAEPSSYLKSQAAYQEALKRYEEEKNADAKRYDDQLAKYNAELKTEQARRDRNCRAGDVSQCQVTTPPAAPPPAAAPAPKPVTQAAAKPAAKPVAKPAKKPASKVTTSADPNERPRIY